MNFALIPEEVFLLLFPFIPYHWLCPLLVEENRLRDCINTLSLSGAGPLLCFSHRSLAISGRGELGRLSVEFTNALLQVPYSLRSVLEPGGYRPLLGLKLLYSIRRVLKLIEKLQKELQDLLDSGRCVFKTNYDEAKGILGVLDLGRQDLIYISSLSI